MVSVKGIILCLLGSNTCRPTDLEVPGSNVVHYSYVFPWSTVPPQNHPRVHFVQGMLLVILPDKRLFIELCLGYIEFASVLLEFSSNQLQTLEQWSFLVSGRCVMTFQGHTLCSSGFIQDFLDHHVDWCRLNDVHVRWTDMHSMNRLRLKCRQCVKAGSPY